MNLHVKQEAWYSRILHMRIFIPLKERLMGLFGSASGKEVDDFARGLVDTVVTFRPPKGKVSPGSPGVSLKTLEQRVDALFATATAFRKEHKLGIYKKARLANSFRWEMKERGYEDSFIELITEKLVVALARKD